MILRVLGVAVLAVGVSSAAFAASANKAKPNLRDQEQAACYDDATRLCKDAVPDEKKIEVCMRAHMSEVSKGCQKFFHK